MPYQIVAGHDNPGTLVDLTIQPRSNGTFTTMPDIVSGDGTVYEDGPLSAQWIYSVLDETEYVTILSETGLTSVKSALVTIRTQNNARAFANYNAVIVRPGKLTYHFFWDNVIFELRNLEAL